VFEFCPVVPADFSVLLELNEASVPHVNSIDEAQMARFLGQATAFVQVVEDGRLAGFAICLSSGVDYASPNYQWFERESADFLYVDRIMVHPDFRRRGVARLLYAELTARALDLGLQRLCCEVNLMPVNPDSLALHRQLGFVQVGAQHTTGGEKEVALLIKELSVDLVPGTDR
jgi:predicted GNAT superfamily acetyltransferase